MFLVPDLISLHWTTSQSSYGRSKCWSGAAGDRPTFQDLVDSCTGIAAATGHSSYAPTVQGEGSNPIANETETEGYENELLTPTAPIDAGPRGSGVRLAPAPVVELGGLAAGATGFWFTRSPGARLPGHGVRRAVMPGTPPASTPFRAGERELKHVAADVAPTNQHQRGS